MALRLFLVGVVASLALDFPNAGSSTPRPRGTSPVSILMAQLTTEPEAVAAIDPAPSPAIFGEEPIAEAAKPVNPVTEIPPVVTAEPVTSAAPVVVDAPKTETPAPVVTEAPKVEAPAPIAAEAPKVVAPVVVEAAKAETPAPVVVEAPKPEAPVAVSVPVVEAPKVETPAVDPVPALAPVVVEAAKPEPEAPSPMPAPEPSPALVSTPNPASDAAPAPVPTVVATEPMPAPAVSAEVIAPVIVDAETPADPDQAFRAIVRKMAKEFAADTPAPAPTDEPKPLIAREDVTTPTAPEAAPAPPPAIDVAEIDEADLFPGVAFAINRSAEGLAPIPMEVATRIEPEPAPAAETVTEPSIDPSRAERLANAVKLTSQAMNAWAGILSQRPGVSSLQR